jgi:flavodoxin
MQQVLVTFAPDTADARRIVDEVKAAFEGPDAAVTVKPASQSSILDIEPANLVLFGVGRTDADIPSDYAELVRVFPGCNLAGKAAAFFPLGAVKASTALRRALKPTEISILDEEPGPGEKAGRPELRDWALVVKEFLKGVHDGRR